MNARVIALVSLTLLPLSAACAAETEVDEELSGES